MKRKPPPDPRVLRQAIASYISIRTLRRLAAHEGAVARAALLLDSPPPELLAVIEMLSALLRPLPNDPITRPDDVAGLLMVEMSHLTQEHFRVICLNTKGYVQEIQTLYQGSLKRTEIRVGEVFREAIRRNSASIILVHNHPSGDPTPSPDDIALTKRVRRAGKLFNIRVLDHLIIGKGQWVSLGDLGVI